VEARDLLCRLLHSHKLHMIGIKKTNICMALRQHSTSEAMCCDEGETKNSY
jgi:hypothetical protein